MGAFIVYLIKSSICMFFFVLINKVLLERETFHLFNRVAWLAILAISLLLPFFDWIDFGSFNSVEMVQSFEAVTMIDDVQMLAVVKDTSYFGIIVSCIIAAYLLFSLFFGLKLMIAYCKLFTVLRSPKINSTEYRSLLEQCKSVVGFHKEVQLIVREEDIAPFSWMNYIVISHTDLENSGREILIHELSHIKSKHSLDLIFVDLISIFQWFNPALWLAKRAIMQVHEYSADTSVIESGVDAKQYQLLLIKKAVGQRFYSMANSFNHSKLKKRITMMLQKKSSKWALAKCLYALPLALFAVAAFANPEVSNHLDEISSVEVTQNFEMSEFFSEKKTPVSNDEVKEVSGDIVKDTTICVVERDSAKYTYEWYTAQESKDADLALSYARKVSEDTTSNKRIGVVQKGDNFLEVKDDDIFAVVEEAPIFPEGNVSKWVVQRIKYPVESQKNKIEGRVYVKFVIEKDGSVSNVEIMRGVDANLDTEAIRVVKSMPKWKPGKQRGKAVRCTFQMPINFSLSKSSASKAKELDDDIFAVVQDPPVFPDGNVSAWVAKRIKYPVAAQKYKMEARVFLKFVIEKDGSVSNVKVMSGVDVNLDAEAVRVVKSMPKWTPGKQKGEAVRCSFKLPVNVKVPDDYVFSTVETAPVFPGGNVSAWIAKRIKYPVEAMKNKIEGRVFIRFVIERDGSVSTVEILRGVDKKLDDEAIRVVKSMPKWTSGKQKGEAVRCSFQMPINFRLESRSPEQPKK